MHLILIMATRAVTLIFLFLVTVGLIGFVTTSTVNHFAERLGGVNRLLVREGWLIALHRWFNGDPNPLKCGRTRSKSGAQAEHVQRTLASTLLIRGTFIVLFLRYVSYRQWTFLSLARDAHNA